MPRAMTDRRFDVLAALELNPRATLKDLCIATGIKSPANVLYHLRVLEKEGYIQPRPRRAARSIYLTGSKTPKGKKVASPETNAKKAAAGRQTRLVIESVGKIKRDDDLEKRIEAIGKRNDAKDHSTDVINSYHKLKFHSSGLKVTRLG